LILATGMTTGRRTVFANRSSYRSSCVNALSELSFVKPRSWLQRRFINAVYASVRFPV